MKKHTDIVYYECLLWFLKECRFDPTILSNGTQLEWNGRQTWTRGLVYMNQNHRQGLDKEAKGKVTLGWTINNSYTTRLKILCTFVFMKAAVVRGDFWGINSRRDPRISNRRRLTSWHLSDYLHYLEVDSTNFSITIGSFPWSLRLQPVISHAPITPNFPSGSNCAIVGDYDKKIDVGPPLLTLLQPRCQKMMS